MHDHAHHTHAHPTIGSTPVAAFRWGIGLNLGYVMLEAIAGFAFHSMALVSDAGHNFSDVISLVLVMVGFSLSKRKPTKVLTYGMGKSTVLISLLNAFLLLGGMGAIAYEGFQRILHPVAVDGGVVAGVAAVGLLVNAFSAYLFFSHQKKELNAKGAFLHLAADAAVSAGVVGSGLLMLYFDVPWFDGAISLAIAGVVFYSTWQLFQESLRLTLDGVPASIDLNKVEEVVLAIPGVADIHHVHTWAISTTRVALTAHIVVQEHKMEQAIALKDRIKFKLAEVGIDHATLELELPGGTCTDALHGEPRHSHTH